ncbi:alpha-ketoglutarate-dependent dioxygenase AlkB [Brevundimonas mediterranea]|uniref:Alkylated DNA repair protein (DNA oxidative demethylase) n=1 Tax=Brevundimonas mediterranea TaxID=74329 RepID=A0A7W6F075_9CAUL|nr:alpha-ketoglutarate-dependent dioxygenase AlkB [Brevundimonas mediterranea]MBB3872801.1 alkylated DNA repair protein (DNA oxidative demethylase) [Brevundimonas mediterranea]
MSAILEVKTAVEGFRLWPGALDAQAQTDLVDAVFARLEAGPFYRPQTPGGRPFSVQMSNFGPLGWVSDPVGYRYQPTHPETGRAWPDIPPVLLDLWDATVGEPRRPDACLVNLYREGAKMGLHQDKDEADLGAPVLSVSLGDAAMFRIGAAQGGRTTTLRLDSGDVCALTGPARLARHGIDRVLEGSSRLIPGGGRLNLTLRVAGISPR